MLQQALDVLREEAGETETWEEQLIGALSRTREALAALPPLLEDTRSEFRNWRRWWASPTATLIGRASRDLVLLGRLAFSADPRPEADWMVRAGLQRGQEVLGQTGGFFLAYQEHRTAVYEEWRPEVLDLDIADLARRYNDLIGRQAQLTETWNESHQQLDGAALLERFETQYTGVFSKLSGARRADVKTIRAARKDNKLPEQVVDELQYLADAQKLASDISDQVAVLRLDERMPTDLPAELERIRDLQDRGARCDAEAERCQQAFGSYFRGATPTRRRPRRPLRSPLKPSACARPTLTCEF